MHMCVRVYNEQEYEREREGGGETPWWITVNAVGYAHAYLFAEDRKFSQVVSRNLQYWQC